GDEQLAALLQGGEVVAHPHVIGEVALGHLVNRARVIDALQSLAQAPVAADTEVLGIIGRLRLHGKGIGYVDAHLIASCLLAPPTRLWTRDKRLQTVAVGMGLAAVVAH
ncbi:MAG: hypothetical protein RLZZ126_259, partial [Pseudomonadota bacterium]